MIRIQNASFRWSDHQPLFDNLSLSLTRGKITAIWGPTGSGKSTLVQILQRKYPLAAGEIMLDGRLIKQYDLHHYREMISLIPQQVKTFNGTLAENILLGRRINGMHGLELLLQEYGFDDYLRRFERGWLTLLGENGRHLSGGELQMLALIRSLLHQPEVLLIDEGLNALDSVMEKMIFATLQRYARAHIIMINTHNLAVIHRVDYLYVLHSGRILQAGTPQGLINSEGYFKNVWDMWRNEKNEPAL